MRRFAMFALVISFMALGAGVARAQSLHIGGFGGSIGGIVVGPGSSGPPVVSAPPAPALGTGTSPSAAPAAPGGPGSSAPTLPAPAVPSPKVGPVHVPTTMGGK